MRGTPGSIGQRWWPMDVFGLSLEMAAIVLLVAVVAVAVGGFLFLRLRRSPADAFVEVVADKHAVDLLLHPNPDPDAMASGLAASTIVKSVGVEPRIVYPGRLQYDENRAFRTVLELDMVRLEDVNDFRDRPIVLIDHAQPRGFPASMHVEPIAIIDHHDDPPAKAAHVDVRPDYGATSTIFWEYLDDLGAVPEGQTGDLVISRELATAMAYGIQTDTHGLTRGVTTHDIRALEGLHALVDNSALERIATPSVNAGTLEAKAAAIENRRVDGPYCVSDLGTVDSADAVAVTAEELVTLEGVTSAVAIGEHDGTLYLSGRSIDDRVHVGEALERAMEPVPGASAGGHARMGGAQVLVEALDGLGPSTGLDREELPDMVVSALRGSD